MKSIVILSVAAAALAAGVANAGDAKLEAPIRQLETAFNKGDVKAARAVHVASPLIVDEVAPYRWSGPKAFDSWLAALTKAEAAEGKTGGQVSFGAPTRETVSGDTAYVFTPSTYTFKQKGQMVRETGTMTFALTRTKAGWKIAAWTWTSPEGAPVK